VGGGGVNTHCIRLGGDETSEKEEERRVDGDV